MIRSWNHHLKSPKMVSFWNNSSSTTSTTNVPCRWLERLQAAETKLIDLAQQYQFHQHDETVLSSPLITMTPVDTRIPQSCIPAFADQEGELNIHGIHVQSKSTTTTTSTSTSTTTSTSKSEYPIVTLHGYYNGAAYYYQNLAGLAAELPGTSIWSLDWLGWGLSSRPKYRGKTVEYAEDWFVESLEAWRQQQKMDKMILVGHSFGGYMSVAYAERYPQHVDQLILLSPVGVPTADDPSVKERLARFSSSWRSKIMLGFFQTVFDYTTVGGVLRRYVSEERAYQMVRNYVERRLPQIHDPHEQSALTDYLYSNAMATGSGESAIHSILNSSILAKRPLVDRIPRLDISKVTMVYGQYDWMDMSAALTAQRQATSSSSSSSAASPEIQVYMVPQAGHLLMLENYKGTNAAILHGILPSKNNNMMEAQDDKGYPKILWEPILVDPGPEPRPDSQVRKEIMASLQQQHASRHLRHSTKSTWQVPSPSTLRTTSTTPAQ